MPRLHVILKDAVFILIVLVLVPALILFLLGLPNGLISTLIYFQLIIIWIQTELSLRQQALFKSQAFPVLTLSYSSTEATVVHEDSNITKTVTITVRNLSDNPAFNVLISRILTEGYMPVKPDVWKKFIRCSIIDHLAPKEEKTLCSTTWSELKDLMKIAKVLEISYLDKYGGWHSEPFIITIDKATRRLVFAPIPSEGELEQLGILLPRLNRIASLLWLYRISKKLKRKRVLQ